MKILIDNGHGAETPGKRSPDGMLREWKWAREIAIRLERELTRRGFDAQRLVTEEKDVPLTERCRRANRFCALLGAKNVLLISIHANAAGSDGRWRDARGFCAFVANNASDSSKRLAASLTGLAIERGLTGNRSNPPSGYWQQSLAICRDTKCPAVLTESGFMDNREDCRWLMSEEGKQAVVALHADAITAYALSTKV